MQDIINKIGADAINLGVIAPISEEEFQRQVKIILENKGNPEKIIMLLDINPTIFIIAVVNAGNSTLSNPANISFIGFNNIGATNNNNIKATITIITGVLIALLTTTFILPLIF